MTRDQFYPVENVPVLELLLDTQNARIRHGADQMDCISRILRDETPFMNLLRDIAQNGLSPEHVLVSPTADDKWVVRDGNRRVTALKLLNYPDLCPVDRLKPLIAHIARNNAGRYPTVINCLACNEEEVILFYLERKHTGENEGVGQRRWSPLLRTLFNIQHGHPEQNKRAAQLILWAEGEGVVVEDDFPLTTLTRFLNQETLNVLGFAVEEDQLCLTLPREQALRLVHRIIDDLQTGRKKVNDIFTPDQQRAYVKSLREELGPPLGKADFPSLAEGVGGQEGSTPATASPPSASPNTSNGEPAPPGGRASAGSGETRRPPSPVTPSWERPHLFIRNHPGFGIPVGYTKVANVVAELKRLKVRETPQAVAMLLRTLIELSEIYYRERNALREAEGLHRKLAAAADHMLENDRLSEGQHDVMIRRTREEGGMLHVKTLHGYVHSADFHPSYQMLNTLWDEVGYFVAACWRA